MLANYKGVQLKISKGFKVDNIMIFFREGAIAPSGICIIFRNMHFFPTSQHTIVPVYSRLLNLREALASSINRKLSSSPLVVGLVALLVDATLPPYSIVVPSNRCFEAHNCLL